MNSQAEWQVGSQCRGVYLRHYPEFRVSTARASSTPTGTLDLNNIFYNGNFLKAFPLHYCRKTSSNVSWFTILSWEQRQKFIDQTDKNRLKRQQMLLIYWGIRNLTFGGCIVCWYHSFSVNNLHPSHTYYEAFFISRFLWQVQTTRFWVASFTFCH